MSNYYFKNYDFNMLLVTFTYSIINISLVNVTIINVLCLKLPIYFKWLKLTVLTLLTKF